MTTLLRIRKKVRRLTSTPDTIQLPDADIDDYIDTFYENDLPQHLQLFTLHKTYIFYTEPNEDQYTLPVNTWTSVGPPIYMAGYQSEFDINRDSFFQKYPILNYDENTIAGNGTSGPYSFTLSNVPVLKRQVTISAIDSNGDTLVLTDDGAGNLTLDGDTTVRGTINYVSGAVAITDWSNTIPSTTTMNAQTVPYVASRPRAALFYDNMFTLRPVPDKAYRIELDAYRKPSQLLNADTDEPEIQQWWEYIAYGAAKKVLADRGDQDTLQFIEPLMQEQKELILHRTIIQQTPERTPTIYSDQAGAAGGDFYRGWF